MSLTTEEARLTLWMAIRPWEVASVVFFAYAAAAALAVQGLSSRQRAQSLSGAGAGIALTLLSIEIPASQVIHDWIVPPLLLLFAYWTSGRLFVAPMTAVERALARFDERAGVLRLAAAAPRWLVELLEIAYAGVYPFIPIALGLSLLFNPEHDTTRFWTVVLVTDYVCFGVLPWIQTRPPRSLEGQHPWPSAVRGFNVGLLGAASIHVNTFPSGHAAEALVAALLLLAAPLPVVVGMFVGALAISAGAVGGRYHYLPDVLLGWLVAVLVWILV